jgi:hypothetical protein
MNDEILRQLEQWFKQEVKHLGIDRDFGKLEQAVMEKMMSLGKGLLQRLVDGGRNGYQGSSIPCSCGEAMRFIQHRPRDLHSLFGWIKVKRAYYHCPDCRSSSAPYDATSGLGSEQISPGLAKACCLLAVDDSFEQTSRKIKRLLGQKVSDNTIERVVQKVGSVVVDQQDQQLQEFLDHKHIPEAQSRPDRLYVAVDGTTAHEVDGWHEAKVGSLYWENERGEHVSKFVGRFDHSATFGWHVWLEACKCGLRQAGEVVYLGDGAGWIRTEHYRHFGRATFIIDWYHASEHLWDCGKKLFGEGTKQTAEWVDERLSWLGEGYTRRLLDNLRQEAKRYRGDKKKAIQSLYDYIETNEQAMRYDVFRDQGYDIGSGAVEGACKNVVGKRLKQSGMIWTRTGSSSVLALRVTWLNESWEQLWKERPLVA